VNRVASASAFTASRLWRWAFVALILVYSALLLFQSGHGLASLDGHGAIRTTRALIDRHHVEVSRPPGHPTTEYYLSGICAFILRSALGREFGEQEYLWLQALAGVATLLVFYRILCRIADPWKVFVASIALALSPQFFANAVDGEEFVWALLFLLLSLQFLIFPGAQQPSLKNLFGSAFCFALATGCRPEAIFAAAMFPIYFRLHPELRFRDAFRFAILLCFLIVVVWAPVLFIGLQPPWTAGMNLRESLLGGAYRLLFQCFNPVVFAVFCWILIRAATEQGSVNRESFPERFVFLSSFVLPLIFGAALFLHASKAAHALFVVPFLLVLALRKPILLTAVTAATVLGFFVTVDIFKDRQLVRPYLVPGAYAQAVEAKPYYRIGYLRSLLDRFEPGPTLIVANAWSWDFDYHVARGTLAARKEHRAGPESRDLSIFRPQQRQGCVLVPRDSMFETSFLQSFATSGYLLKMDRLLYRTVYSRYDLNAQTPDEVTIGELKFRLF
jgi:hypothetical protein